MLSKIEPNKEGSRWENTICFFGDIQSKYLMEMPSGICMNLLSIDENCTSYYPDHDYAKLPTKYVIITSGNKTVYDHYLESNYSIIGQYNEYVLFINNIYN